MIQEIQIVVPPVSGGVFDFGLKLVNNFDSTKTRLVSLSKENASQWRIQRDEAVFLQLSSYGFEKRGTPLWLMREIERRRKHIRHLGVFFHELYAFGPPWTSSFWLSPMQRHISRRLVEMSDFWMTNREGSCQWLVRFAGEKPHAVLPVFSNVGELDTLPRKRLRKLIVFGGAGLRQATYLAAGERLFAWANSASLEIHDIGMPISDRQLADTLRGKGVVLHGRLDIDGISRAMKEAMFGLLAYPVGYVAKSGVFAAYCGHGMCPVLLSQTYGAADGLVAGRHYLQGVPGRSVDADHVATIAEAAFVWYQPHRLQKHIDAIHGFLGDREGR